MNRIPQVLESYDKVCMNFRLGLVLRTPEEPARVVATKGGNMTVVLASMSSGPAPFPILGSQISKLKALTSLGGLRAGSPEHPSSNCFF